MLDEEMRILAGMQKSRHVKNELTDFLIEKENQILFEQQRINDEKKTVIAHFNEFNERMNYFSSVICEVMTLFEGDKSKEFISGLYDEKFVTMQKFADSVLNDSPDVSIAFLFNNYQTISEELEKISALQFKIDEGKAHIYFSSREINSDEIKLYLDPLCETQSDKSIPYGTKIVCIDNNTAIFKFDGKMFYSNLSLTEVLDFEKKGLFV